MPENSREGVRRIERKYRRVKRRLFLQRLRASLPLYLTLLLLIGGFALFLVLGRQNRGTDRTVTAAALRVYVLDVGQGDAILIESDGHAALIDAGEADQGQRVVQMLHALGVRKLDYVISSHPHSDHSGGLRTVLSQIPSGQLMLPVVPDALMPTGYGYSQMLGICAQKGIAVRQPACRDSVQIGAAELEFLCTDNSAFEDLNDCSLVCLLTCGNVRFLFTGDLEEAGEEALLREGLIPPVTVLKAAHHGSSHATTEVFLRAAQPKFAVISVGAVNDYGHPASKTLQRLRDAGSGIYRTDLDGTVCFAADSDTIRVQTQISF